MKLLKKTAALLLCVVMIATAFSSCGEKEPPDITAYKAEFQALIEASAEVNDIFFGPGLAIYERDDASGDGNLKYDDSSAIYYGLIEDETYGTVFKFYDNNIKAYKYAAPIEKVPSAGIEGTLYFVGNGEIYYNDGEKVSVYSILETYQEKDKEIVYDETSPVYYDYVRLDCKYQTVESIKELAEKVYSANYLSSVYVTMFDGLLTEGSMIYARYMPDESGNTDFLLKSNRFEPFFEKQTTYDFSTMKSINPSTEDSILVSIEGYGTYIDTESASIKEGKITRNIRFVRDADGWRLDTPTY